jgi:hypothetical protein
MMTLNDLEGNGHGLEILSWHLMEDLRKTTNNLVKIGHDRANTGTRPYLAKHIASV